MDFLELYNIVFNEKKEVKLCGRANCIKLINFCDKYEPDVKHGDNIDGFMDIEKILAFKEKVDQGLITI